MFDKNETMYYYSADEMKHLKKLCYSICKSHGWLNDASGVRRECDDVYAIANEVLMDSCNSYDEEKKIPFSAYLFNNIKLRVDSYIRDNNAKKRIPADNFVYIDAQTTEKHPLIETLAGGKTVEETVFEQEQTNGKAEMFLERLSKKQNGIVSLLLEGKTKSEILKELNMDSKEYDVHLIKIKSLAIMLKR